MMGMDMDEDDGSYGSAGRSQIAGTKMPMPDNWQSGEGPDFTVMANSDGRAICEDDPEKRRNARQF